MNKVLLALLLFPAVIFAQTEDAVPVDSAAGIPIIAYWEIGDLYHFEVKKIDIRFKNGEEVKNDTTIKMIAFEVLDSTATNYRLKWHLENVSDDWMDGITEEGLAELAPYMNFELTYLTDELGAFQEFENLEGLTEMIQKIIELVSEEQLAAMPDSVRDKARDMMGSMMTPQLMINNILSEVQLIHYPYGVEYVVGDTIAYEEMLPNNFGGDPIKAQSVLYVDSVDVSDDYVHLKQLMDLDEDDTIKMLTDLFKRLGMPKAKMEKEMKDARYIIRNDNDYHYYYYPGIPIYIDYFRELEMKIASEDGGRIMRTQIRWID